MPAPPMRLSHQLPRSEVCEHRGKKSEPDELRSDAITNLYSGIASSQCPNARSRWALAVCAMMLFGEIAKACSTASFARKRSSSRVLDMAANRRPVSANANAPCASTDRGSRATAFSNRSTASAKFSRVGASSRSYVTTLQRHPGSSHRLVCRALRRYKVRQSSRRAQGLLHARRQPRSSIGRRIGSPASVHA